MFRELSKRSHLWRTGAVSLKSPFELKLRAYAPVDATLYLPHPLCPGQSVTLCGHFWSPICTFDRRLKCKPSYLQTYPRRLLPGGLSVAFAWWERRATWPKAQLRGLLTTAGVHNALITLQQKPLKFESKHLQKVQRPPVQNSFGGERLNHLGGLRMKGPHLISDHLTSVHQVCYNAVIKHLLYIRLSRSSTASSPSK